MCGAMPGPAVADAAVPIVYADTATSDCLAAANTPDAQHACIGLSSQACMTANDYGSTTAGSVECVSRETGFWDNRLNAIYAQYMQSARALDSQDVGGPGPANMAVSLRDMQRAWIAFRDATCTFQFSLGRGGTIAHQFSAGCAMDMTAQQYLYLKNNVTPDLNPDL